MEVLLDLVMIAILVGVFLVAIGMGGELAYEQADHAPLDLGPVSPTDVALLRPPTALWGYNMQVTDEALDAIARTLRDRDIQIAYLQRQLADLGHMPAVDEAERTPGRHASSWSSDETDNPWSRLWTPDSPAAAGTTAAAVTVGETTVGETTAANEPTEAETTAAETTTATEEPAKTAALPAADDTAITTYDDEPAVDGPDAEEQGW
jgi:hypothetical protein